MSLRKVKRNLFGSVKKQTLEYLKSEELKFIADKSREWNFDFIEFVPLNDGSFLWSKIENKTKVMQILNVDKRNVCTSRQVVNVDKSNVCTSRQVVNLDKSNVGTSRKRRMKTTSKQHQKSIKGKTKINLTASFELLKKN